MSQPSAADALTRLEPLVGAWTLEASPPGGEPLPGGGRSTFERHPSGAHLMQRTVVEVPEAPDSLSIIGCDAANGVLGGPRAPSPLHKGSRGQAVEIVVL